MCPYRPANIHTKWHNSSLCSSDDASCQQHKKCALYLISLGPHTGLVTKREFLLTATAFLAIFYLLHVRKEKKKWLFENFSPTVQHPFSIELHILTDIYVMFICICKTLLYFFLNFIPMSYSIFYLARKQKIWFSLLHAFFWVISRCLNFICRTFRNTSVLWTAPNLSPSFLLAHAIFEPNLSLYKHSNFSEIQSYFIPTCLWRWNIQSVPKRRHIKFRRRGIAHKRAYNIQNTATIWNQEWFSLVY